MSKTTIEWTQRPGSKPETWNPTTGCNKVSQGCKNCYAEVMHKRLTDMGQEKYQEPFLSGAKEHPDTLRIPMGWKTPRTVFVNSMSDLFHKDVSWNFIYKVFEVMLLTPQHTYMVLTKRAERLKEIADINLHLKRNYPDAVFPLPNVWVLVSVENQGAADERIPMLVQCQAAVRGLSCEPLLGKIYFNPFVCDTLLGRMQMPALLSIDWVIAGGESGHQARPMHPIWLKHIMYQCKAAGVPFFFKQWGEWVEGCTGSIAIKKMAMVYADTGETETGIIQRGRNAHLMSKVGKKLSGRKLNGKEYNEFPTQKI